MLKKATIHPLLWRSIWVLLSLIRTGVRQQVGNGHNIQIWRYKWTTSLTTYQIVLPPKILPNDAKVCAIIDADNGEWKAHLIRDIFLEHEVDSILSIPLSTTLLEDKLLWTAVANGKFSVKSAYHLARKGSRNGGESSNPLGMRRFWKIIQQARVPNKVRNFGQRACQNIFPTKMNLYYRQVLKDPICEECAGGTQSVIHVLCECKKAREVWSFSKLCHMVEGQRVFTDILLNIVMNPITDSGLLEVILTIAWYIWKNQE